MDIDFVIIWVDGNDPKWAKERDLYEVKTQSDIDSSIHRYRDWNNLQYWFRAVEKYTPWVRTVHFVTWGHVPKWLNIKNPKLHIVNHKDFIPEKYLPTFSSHTIELNLHRIEGLSEHFVYFNDDMFILDKMSKEEFFKKGKPCDSAIMNVHCYNMEEMFILAPFRDIGIINHYFNMKRVIKQNPFGWFNPKYGVDNIRNLILLLCPRFPGILQQHLPASYCKETFKIVWEKEYEILDETCSHKFRSIADVNQWVFKEWQLACGNFYPRKLKIGTSIPAYHLDTAYGCIRNQKTKMLCFNDSDMREEEFLKASEKINKSFDAILPEKSTFEI